MEHNPTSRFTMDMVSHDLPKSLEYKGFNYPRDVIILIDGDFSCTSFLFCIFIGQIKTLLKNEIYMVIRIKKEKEREREKYMII